MGVLICLLVAVFAIPLAVLMSSAWRARRAFIEADGAFRCNVRLCSAHAEAVAPTWSRACGHAIWIHDVLVIRNGLFRARLQHLPVHMAEGELVPLDPRRVPGLGPRPVSVRVNLDSRSEIELAAAGEDRGLLVGPFVVAAMSGQSGEQPPREHRGRRGRPWRRPSE